MSKRSLFWSTASGKLGDIVLRSVHGETIASKYQPQVANPRSYAQMYVRAQFATAVKFYRHANDNLFKFAFEDKKRNESDYNAFMRYNAKRGCIIDDLRTKTYPYPAWGPSWQLTNGSLPECPVKVAGVYAVINLPSIGELNGLTIKKVSAAFVKDYGLQYGDYVTFVYIRTGYSSYEYFEDIPQPKWIIRQIQLLDDDTDTELSDYGIQAAISEGEKLNIQINELSSDTSASAFAAIFSRVTKTQTYVSPSFTVGNQMWNNIVGNYTSQAAIDINVATWGATPNAILKGSIADEANKELHTLRANDTGNKSSSAEHDEEHGSTSASQKSTKSTK